MLSYTVYYEKEGTPFLRIEDVRALGSIIRPILARIQAAECSSGSAIS
jgi:hypothetical protein